MWTETIKVQPPYNFDLVVERLALDPLHVINREERTVKVPLYIEGKPIVLYVQAEGNTNDPLFTFSGHTHEQREQAIARLKRVFHFHQPLQEISSHFENTDLKDLFFNHRGTPIVLDFDYYSCLVKCIVHQQLNMNFAHTLTERYVKTFGFELDGVWFYPSPETAARLTVEELRSIQFSGRKAEYVIGLSQEITAGRLDLEALTEQSDQKIMNTLTNIRGIGKWTAENFLLFGVGRPNLFPKADIGIQNAMKQLFGLQQKPTQEEMEKYSLSWSPYLSYASLYLWRSIEKRSDKK